MYRASKQLQAVRKQLRDMDNLYRNNSDGQTEDKSSNDVSNPPTTQDSNSLNNQMGANITMLPFTGGSTDTPGMDLGDFNGNSLTGVAVMSIMEGTDKSSDKLPLSEELRCAISNLEEIDDVDNLIGDVMCSMVVEPSAAEELHPFQQSIVESILVDDAAEADDTSVDEYASSHDTYSIHANLTKEEMRLRRDRQRKDNHNIIERRRRYNINDRIKELAALLPPSTHPDSKLNKGSILKATVKYVKALKKDQEHLETLKATLNNVQSKYQKALVRIFQLELQVKLYGFTENISQKKRKRTKKNNIEQINKMVGSLIKCNYPGQLSVLEKEQNLSPLTTDEQQDVEDALDSMKTSSNIPVHAFNSKQDTQHLMKRNSRPSPKSPKHSFDYQTGISGRKVPTAKTPYSSKEIHITQNGVEDLKLEKFRSKRNGEFFDFLSYENVSSLALSMETEPSEQGDIESGVAFTDGSVSPVTPGSDMLKSLLRSSRISSSEGEKSYGQRVPGTSSVEDSSESSCGIG